MNVLVINAGSSSLKYQFLNAETGAVLARGGAERIGLKDAFIKHSLNGADPLTLSIDLPDHKVAVQAVLGALTSDQHGVIKSMSEIDAVGHRVVHGGEKFASSVLITPEVKKAIRACFDLAPLHNPPNMTGIEACEDAMPGVPQVAVFDTAFHQSMPRKAYMYALPYALYEKHGIRRYGFHGTSHAYVSQRAAAVLQKPYESLKIITCHLGNGSSIAAIRNGRCIDTSMGLTPLAGICMGTRCGDIDPAIVTFLQDKEGLDTHSVDELLNKKSGVMGLSGVSSDFRDLYAAAGEGHKLASLALDMFKYQCRKYIGAYAAAMGGVDAVVFTAGIAENTPDIRLGACDGLAYMGITIDPYKNNAVKAREAIVSTDDSPVKVLVIPTNEELAIARETARVCGIAI
ncbi:MAG: acetate kinase [Eubacteriales bacterium]|nr:acetate kinase [Eubacteriales bacterium]MDD4744939.1 acetate kinase [Eubacteriales bacterium]